MEKDTIILSLASIVFIYSVFHSVKNQLILRKYGQQEKNQMIEREI